MMYDFVIEPYRGAPPICFGQSFQEVESVLGLPGFTGETYYGNRTERRVGLTLGYDKTDGHLYSIILYPPTIVRHASHSLFEKSDLVEYLIHLDGCPFEWVGSLMYMNLGIVLSGFHNDSGEKVMELFERGHYDGYRDMFRDYHGRVKLPN